MTKKILILTGPTASGKTKTAIRIAKKNNAEIICADSRIIYKDLNIVSAKPDTIEQEGIKHHLIDILTVEDEFSAGDFVIQAKSAIDEIPAGSMSQANTFALGKSPLCSLIICLTRATLL